MQRRTFLKVGTGAAVSATLQACGGGHGDAPSGPPTRIKAVSGWNDVALQAIRAVKPGPPMAARSLAMVHTSMYNAWAAFDAVAQATPHGASARRPASQQTADNRRAALSYAAHAALSDQFPTQTALFDAYLAQLGYAPAGSVFDPASPAAIGLVQANAMLGYCHHDGANQLGDLGGGAAYADYTGYVARNPVLAIGQPTPLGAIPAPGNWQPLSYVDAGGVLRQQPYLAACWDRVLPFALTSASQYRPAPPAAFGSDAFAAQAQRILEVQLALTERQKVIAQYWADGPNSELPPGHWCLLAQQVSARDAHTDDQDVKMFFALTNALADAAIAAWDAKRCYDSARPITALRYLLSGRSVPGYGPEGPAGGLRPIDGAAWLPYQPLTFPTPPFPEHVSGHSTFSAAAAEVLRRFTGSDSFGASFTHAARTLTLEPALPSADLTLRWDTFSKAAEEAGMSRIYGGIHFDNANTAGQQLGRQVGTDVYLKAERFWRGLA